LLPHEEYNVMHAIRLSKYKLENPTGCHTLAKQIEYKTVIDSLHGA
jgi:hypothetical protein